MAPSWIEDLIKAFQQQLLEGRTYVRIGEARREASALLGQPIRPGDPLTKVVDEAMEKAVVRTAKQLVDSSDTSHQAYDRMVDLMTRQPNLSVRTSTSVLQQAYSTPVPIAYLASTLAGIAPNTSVYEPTAGNGALLIDADPTKVIANELNSDRHDELTQRGYAQLTQHDATSYSPGQKIVDVVITNPPFGSVKGENGKRRHFPIGDTWSAQVDHGIAMTALAAMKDEGKAVLILGGKRGVEEEYRSERYNSRESRGFFYTLYGQYNVTDHFSLDGDLYRKQGAGFPIDVVVIEGRGKSARPLPAAAVPEIYNSLSALKEKLPNVIRASQVLRLPEPMGDENTFTSVHGQSLGEPDTGRRDLSRADSSQSRGADHQLDNRTAGEPEGDATPPMQTHAAEFYPPSIGGGTGRGPTESDDGLDGRVGGDAGALESKHSKYDDRSAGRERLSGQSSNAESPGISGVSGPLQRDDPGSLADRNSPSLISSNSTSPDFEEPPMATQPDDVKDLSATEAEQEMPKQVPYEPKSSGRRIGSLIPQNQASAAQTALSRLEQRQGNVDEFVRDRLNYDTVEEMQGRFFAEQIDSLALAIDNLEQGKGFIIADMTGQGKGCQCAGILRYATQQGKTPIFVTQKKELYADIMRDFKTIGVHDFNPFLTDTNADISLGDGLSLRSGSAADQQTDMRQMMKDGNTSYYDGIFTTYSQLQTVAGKEPLRRDFFRALIGDAVLVLDESHEAGGTKSERDSNNGVANRADFVRELIHGSAAVVYSSATYAKRPDVMDLYAISTDLKSAVENGSSLQSILERGGVPMQQIVSSGIVASGQMLRRERSYEGIEFKAETIPVDREVADAFSSAMRSIMEFDRAKRKALQQLRKDLKAEAKAFGVDNAIGQTAARSTNFTSLMHNSIEQGLLQQKAEAVVQKALQSLQSGKKPVIALDNTMGSFIDMYAGSNNIKSGEPIDITPADSLDRFLERSRDVSTTDHRGMRERRPLSSSELGLEGTMAYESAQEQIQEFRELLATNSNNMPMSPIDYIRHRLEEEGYATAEVTGRKATLQYEEDGSTTYRARPGTETQAKGKIEAVSQFNSGQIDAIILNRSGSTGISLHASEQFVDQRPREMIVAQASKNISEFMQMLGRVHRVGQMEVPSYTLLMSDLPAEKRPGAILSRKMAALNANVTASRETDISIKNVVDFMNPYGEEVVMELLKDLPELNHKLDDPLSKADSTDEIELLCRVTGRIPLLPIEEQEEVYQLLESEYQDFVAQKEAMGENLLEAGQLDLDARTIARMEVIPDESLVKTEFTGAVHLEVVDTKADRKPLTQLEMVNVIRQTLALDPVKEIQQHDRTALEMLATQQADQTITGTKEVTQKHLESLIHPSRNLKLEQKVKIKDKLEDQLRSVQKVLREFPIGSSVRVDTGNQVLYGVVGNVEHKHRSGSPVTPSTWKVQLMLADGNRQMKIPLSQFNTGKKGTPLVMRQEKDLWTNTDIYEKFDEMQRMGRQKRQIFTGNLIKAVQKYPTGKLVNFTDDRNNVRQGLLMPRGFNIDEVLKTQPVPFKQPSQIKGFFELTEGRSAVRSMNELLRVSPAINDGIRLQVPKSKQSGARYYLDEKLLEIIGHEFISKGEHMEVKVPADKVDDVLNHLMHTRAETLAVFDPKYQQQAREYLNLKIPTLETIDSGEYIAQPDYVAPIVEVTGEDRARLERLLRTSPEPLTPAELSEPSAPTEIPNSSAPAAPLPSTPAAVPSSPTPIKVPAQPDFERPMVAPSLSLESSFLNDSTSALPSEPSTVLPAKQQKGPIEKRIATFLDKAGIREALTAGEDFHLKIKNEPYMPLVVERHNDGLYLTHYFEQNGDLCLDSEMVFKIKNDGHLQLSETATQNPFRGGEDRRYDERADRIFAQVFSRNIKEQGFGEAAREQLQQSQMAAAELNSEESQAVNDLSAPAVIQETQASEPVHPVYEPSASEQPNETPVSQPEAPENAMSQVLSNGLENLTQSDRQALRQIVEDYLSAKANDMKSSLGRIHHPATVEKFEESASPSLKPIVLEAMLYGTTGGDLDAIALDNPAHTSQMQQAEIGLNQGKAKATAEVEEGGGSESTSIAQTEASPQVIAPESETYPIKSVPVEDKSVQANRSVDSLYEPCYERHDIYETYKAANPQAIVFVQSPAGYETFAQDAERYAEITNAQLNTIGPEDAPLLLVCQAESILERRIEEVVAQGIAIALVETDGTLQLHTPDAVLELPNEIPAAQPETDSLLADLEAVMGDRQQEAQPQAIAPEPESPLSESGPAPSNAATEQPDEIPATQSEVDSVSEAVEDSVTQPTGFVSEDGLIENRTTLVYEQGSVAVLPEEIESLKTIFSSDLSETDIQENIAQLLADVVPPEHVSAAVEAVLSDRHVFEPVESAETSGLTEAECERAQKILGIAAQAYAFAETQGNVRPSDDLGAWVAEGNYYDIAYAPSSATFSVTGKGESEMVVRSVGGESDPSSFQSVSETDVGRFKSIEQALSQRPFEREQLPIKTLAMARAKWEMVKAAAVAPPAVPVELALSPVVPKEQSLFNIKQYASNAPSRTDLVDSAGVDPTWEKPTKLEVAQKPAEPQQTSAEGNSSTGTGTTQSSAATTAKEASFVNQSRLTWKEKLTNLTQQAQFILDKLGQADSTGTCFEGKTYAISCSTEGSLSVRAETRGEILRVKGSKIQHSTVNADDISKFQSFTHKVQQVSAPVETVLADNRQIAVGLEP